MSVLQTIGTRQSTFTIDSTDVKAASGNGNIEIPIGRDTSADSTSCCGIDLPLDNHKSSKNVNSEAANKHGLTTTNSRLSGSDKPQLNTGKPQAGITATNTHLSIDSNTDAAAKLSSSVRKRLRHIPRRKADINSLKQAGEHTGQVNETVAHDESYSGEHSASRVIVNITETGDSDNICVGTSRIRKTVSFNAHPAIYIDRTTLQLEENRNSHKNLTKPTRNTSDLHSETHSTPTTQATYHRSVEPTFADQSLVFLHQIAEPQINQTSTPVPHCQLEHRASSRKVCPLLDDSSPPKQQPTTPFIPLEHGCDRDRVLLENKERSASNSKKYDKHTKHKNDKKSVAESVENTSRRDVQLTQVAHSKMARSGKFDYANESFEDVLTERNDMAKTERVYRMRIRQLEEELKQMVRQCQGLSNENKELRKTLDGMKATKEKSNNEDMLSKLTKLEAEKAKLVAQYNKLLKQMDSVSTDSAKIKTANVELENAVKELEEQLRSLNTQIKSHESENTRILESQIRDLNSTIKHLEHEKKAVEAKIMSLEYDNTRLTDSLENKRREIDDLTNSLHTRTVTEANLKGLQDENHHLKQDLTEMIEKFRDLEASKQKLQDLFREQDNTFKQIKTDNDEKDKIIAQLRRDSDVNMQEIKKLNESQQASRDREKESLVSRIASLKTEIDSSLSENHKLKQEREEMAKIMEKLRQDNLNALESCKESKKYLRKWEQEKEYRSKVEDDLDKKKEEALMLEIRVKEAEKALSILKDRVKSLENEQDDLHNSTTSSPETNNKVLMDRNMKLRQMLVERNIELTNTKHEQTITDSRIHHLERKQKSAEVHVKQLAEYLGSVVYKSDHEISSETTKVVLISSSKKSPSSQPHKNSSPTQPHKNISKLSPRKATEPFTKESNKICGNEGEHTMSSLPLLQSSSASGPQPRNGYFTLYREKRKRVKDKMYT